MVPADDEHTDSLETTNNTHTKEGHSGRLTPMPDYLMHWWTPLLLATILLATGCFLASIWRMPLRPVSWWKINLYWPPSWPFNYHWPSKDAMALCATIAGAGFAFSAWQQRSHENSAKEYERREQVQRDEYWKRREQAYHLLTSPNPSTRLGAVALLQELADIAPGLQEDSHSESHNFQQHIITTLCSQVRHEGLLIEEEGNRDEHAAIQNEILTYLFTPSKHSDNENNSDTPNIIHINLSHTNFYTPLMLHSLHIEQSLNVRNSTFHSHVTITDSTLNSLYWAHAAFRSQLTISNCTVIHDRFPDCLKEATFSHAIFKLIELKETEHRLQLSEHKKTKSETNIITFNNECRIYGTLKIITREGCGDYSSENITITNSTLDSIEITSGQGYTTNFHAILTISGCKILKRLHIHNITYWYPAAHARTKWELEQMSDQDFRALELEYEAERMYSPSPNPDPAYTDLTYTQQSAIYLINNSFSDAVLEHSPQFESVNGYEDGEGYQSEKFITFENNATLNKRPLVLSQWLNNEDTGEDARDNRRIELLPTGNIANHHLT